MEHQLTIATSTGDDGTTLAVAGELDPATTPQLDDAVAATLGVDGVRRVVLDLAEVGFIDSSGLSALLNARNRAQEVDVDLVVANPSPHCRRLLEATKLTDLLT